MYRQGGADGPQRLEIEASRQSSESGGWFRRSAKWNENLVGRLTGGRAIDFGQFDVSCRCYIYKINAEDLDLIDAMRGRISAQRES